MGTAHANKDKRSVGTHLIWLGFGILTTPGVLYLTKKKMVKLAVQMAAAIEGTLLLANYRSMMGSLEHIVFATNRDRSAMLGLWRPLAGSWEPNNRVPLPRSGAEGADQVVDEFCRRGRWGLGDACCDGDAGTEGGGGYARGTDSHE